MKGKRLDLDKLYFGVVVEDFNTGEFKPINLFDSIKILTSIARYVLRKDKDEYFKQKDFDPLFYCFSSCWSRCEYEFVIESLFAKNASKARKVDTYEMYVKPNAEYLMSLVDNVTAASARRVLKKYKR